MNSMIAGSVSQQISSVLAASSYFDSSVSCKQQGDDCIVLQGIVPTYFQKQMAQEIIRKLNCVKRISNELEVA